jgi:tetratricopeptide (TPR) repeat protein
MKRVPVAAAALALSVALLLTGALAPVGGAGSSSRRSQLRARTHALQALELIREARVQADPAYLTEADRLLDRSLGAKASANYEAFLGRALLANSRHDFTTSVRWARRATKTRPHTAAAYGVLGDALFELGRVRAADGAYQEMIDIRPDLGSFVRASYTFQFAGRPRPAIAAMRSALRSAEPRGAEAAWIRHQLGDIYFGIGDLNRAARQNRIGTEIAPDFVPPTVGLAEVAIARGNLERATRIMKEAVSELPELEYLIKLGDLHSAAGTAKRAENIYDRVVNRLRLYGRHGVLPDVDFVIFYANHRLRVRANVRDARAMYRLRPTAAVADALAWALHAAGRDPAAWPFARRALLTSAIDPEARFHAAIIAMGAGRTDRARTLLTESLRLPGALSPINTLRAQRLVADRLG